MDLRKYYRKNRKAIITATTGILYLGGWSIGYTTTLENISAIILVIATIVGGYDIAKKSYNTLKNRTIGINTLVTIAAIGAILIGKYWEAAAVVFLFTLGNYLEGRTMRKTRNALQELLEMTPNKATVEHGGEQKEIPAREVEEGETVIIKPGDKIPVDGEIIKGESTVNQAPVTGESKPQHKKQGDEVYAGTINQKGGLKVTATGTGSDTTIQRIIEKVEEAQEAKSPTETLLERFSKYYTPSIILLSIGTFILTKNTLMSLTLLVIGCPGALVIGPPVSIVSSIGNAAKNGVLMKGGKHLEKAGKIDLVAFDKTGTLTKGETKIKDIKGFSYSQSEVLRFAGIAEKNSEHHLADAVLEKIKEEKNKEIKTDGGKIIEKTNIPDPNSFDVKAGKGIIATYNGKNILVGNNSLLKENNISPTEDMVSYVGKRENKGETVVYITIDGKVIGVISFEDEIRKKSKDIVQKLKSSGIKTVMLTGDNDSTASSVAKKVGIDEYRSELLPEEKQNIIKEFREEGYVVAMVGDGINDAPSLATADVGIAMGAAGTDTAIETADMALMADDLKRIPYAINLSKSTRKNIYENIGIALFTVVFLLTGVLTSYIHLALGMLVHEGSVLAVILNGMRLLKYKI